MTDQATQAIAKAAAEAAAHNTSPFFWIAGTLGTIVVALISFIGGKGVADAAVQNAISDGFRKLADGQERRITALENERDEYRTRAEELEGNLRQANAKIDGLIRALQRANIEVPNATEPVIEIGILEFRGTTNHG